jgi:hypothetical protein
LGERTPHHAQRGLARKALADPRPLKGNRREGNGNSSEAAFAMLGSSFGEL